MIASFDEGIAVLKDYFEGLHHSNTQILRRGFHPAVIHACATDGTPLTLRMDEYFLIVDQRPSPRGSPPAASRG